MEDSLQFTRILLVLMTVHGNQAAFIQNAYRQLEPGETAIGNVQAALETESNHDCATRYVRFISIAVNH